MLHVSLIEANLLVMKYLKKELKEKSGHEISIL